MRPALDWRWTGTHWRFVAPVTPVHHQAYLHGAAECPDLQQTSLGGRRQNRLAPCCSFAGYGSSGGVGSVLPRSVKVYEAGKQDSGKRIVAETVVQAPVDVVWRVLTSYERLADFVPNLESCELVPNPDTSKVWIRQRGCSQGVLWRLEAEALMEVEEVQLPLGRREARFHMLEGDFKELSGRWVLEPDPSSAVGMATLLRFDITVQPRISLPSSVVSYVVRAGLPANIQAVARRAEEIATSKLRVSGLARWAGTEDDPPIPVQLAAQTRVPAWEQEAAEEEAARAAAAAVDEAVRQQKQEQQQVARYDSLPTKGPFWRLNGSSFPEAAPLTAERQRQQQAALASTLPQTAQSEQSSRPQPDPKSLYLGVVSVPLPPAGNRSSMQAQTQDELEQQQQQQKEQLQATYPPFGLRKASSPSSGSSAGSSSALPVLGGPSISRSLSAPAGAAEVHLRRLDTFDVLHRRAVAAITINAPPEAVWTVLTDYNRLAEFIPNLAVSQRIALPRNAPSNIIRVRQVGYKRVPYMCLHAESVLDLIEKPQSEIQFRQVAGDFERFQGKWMLQEVSAVSPNGGGSSVHAEASGHAGCQTQLKYAVEIVIPRATRMMGVLEPLLEQTVFEDVPTNLAAIKQRVEQLQVERGILLLENAGESAAAAVLRRKLERPSLAEMSEDFAVLASELERCFGADRVLPARHELREMNRTDLEKAIRAHGGPSLVAQQLGWRLKAKGRRPRGYWDSAENVRAELDDFIEEQGLTPGVMPAKNDFIRAGRYDIARAVERWGGLYELASELGYAVGDSRKPGSSEWQEHISEVAATTGLSGREGLFELAAKTYAARRSLQASLDEGEEVALADILANTDVSSGNGRSIGKRVPKRINTDGNNTSKHTASTVNSSVSKANRMSAREEIDAW